MFALAHETSYAKLLFTLQDLWHAVESFHWQWKTKYAWYKSSPLSPFHPSLPLYSSCWKALSLGPQVGYTRLRTLPSALKVYTRLAATTLLALSDCLPGCSYPSLVHLFVVFWRTLFLDRLAASYACGVCVCNIAVGVFARCLPALSQWTCVFMFLCVYFADVITGTGGHRCPVVL